MSRKSNQSKARPVYVVVEGGLVQQVENIPRGLRIEVIDKDTENSDPRDLKISPLDGEACLISTFENS